MSNNQPLDSDTLRDYAMSALEDLKAKDIVCHDVREITDIADTMIIATGTSDTHIRACANNVVESLKEHGERATHVEGLNARPMDWILVDFGAVVVHIMRDDTRAFYDLDGFWSSAIAKVDAQRESTS